MKLSALAAQCCDSLAAVKRSPNTVDSYRGTFAQFVGHVTITLGLSDEPRHFTTTNVLSFQVALHKGGAGANTIRNKMSALSALARYGAKIKDGRGKPVVPENPMLGVDRPKRRKPAEKYLLPAELAAFMAVPLNHRGEEIARALLMDTGLRASELCLLTWGALSEIDGHVTATVRVKGDHMARVPISQEMAARLLEWRMERDFPDPAETVLVNQQNSTPYTRTSLANLTVRIGQRAGIKRLPVRPHVIRHTLNVIRRHAKMDPLLRSQLLTHTSLSSLISYEHVMDGELATARETQWQGIREYLGDYVSRLGAPAKDSPPKSLNL